VEGAADELGDGETEALGEEDGIGLPLAVGEGLAEELGEDALGDGVAAPPRCAGISAMVLTVRKMKVFLIVDSVGLIT
jgi:hypothetical protein